MTTTVLEMLKVPPQPKTVTVVGNGKFVCVGCSIGVDGKMTMNGHHVCATCLELTWEFARGN